MLAFRVFLAVFLVFLSGYTAIVIANHGLNFFPTAFGDMFAMTWQKQFNIDFMGFLLLSAVWTAWRNQFSLQGLLLGVLAFLGGMAFLTIYLLILSYQLKGDVKTMLLGPSRS